ncbi:MAG: HD domain-containing protein [Patescibacteria group bacterium]|nr:HD domain-containing protein [Patescibacteria group bacterium]
MNPFKIINKYYNADSEEYQTLVLHSVMVAKKALEIVSQLTISQSIAENVSREFIYEAAMLHDIGFKFPGELKNKTELASQYLTHGYYGAEILRKEGLPQHAQVAENHVGVGLTRQEIENNKWPMPPKDYFPQTIEEKIISYADLFYSKSYKTSPGFFKERTMEEVIEKIKKYQNGSEKIKVFREWDKIFT